MSLIKFDPFKDRLSRDIRNDLSEAFMRSLNEMNLDPVRQIAGRYLEAQPDNIYQDYIRDRFKRYAEVVNTIQSLGLQDTYEKAVQLWEQGLFFEFHDLLESIWYDAAGTEKIILQALIRAAGTYIHLEHNRMQGAKKNVL